jgi:sulfide dehydrogenase cytochrome subunit
MRNPTKITLKNIGMTQSSPLSSLRSKKWTWKPSSLGASKGGHEDPDVFSRRNAPLQPFARGGIPFGIGVTLLVMGLWGIGTTDVRAAELAACMECHGEQGVTTQEAVPHIGGLNKGYLSTVLAEYADGTRPSTVKAHGDGLTAAQIGQAVAHFSPLPWVNAPENASAADASLAADGGKKSVKCQLCHEDMGRSQEDDMPRLAGQRLTYLLQRIKTFKNNPDYPMPKKMKGMITQLTVEDLTAISHFFASQK